MTGDATDVELDAIAMLMRDHRALLKLFGDFGRLDRGDTDARRGMVELACAELARHMALEEDIFYPAARRRLDGGERLVDEAERDHDAAQALVTRLTALAPDDPAYAATFTQLAERVTDHFAKEEREILLRLEPGALDLHGIAAEMRRHEVGLASAPDTPGQAEPSLEAAGRDEPAAAEALRAAARERDSG